MKKLFSILCVLAVMTNIKAQDYIPLPTSAVWSEYFNAPISTSLASYYYRNILTEKDTVVGANTYHQLYWSYSDTAYNDSPTVLYKGGIRENNRQVFFLPKDSVHEYLLYDFSLEMGDKIKYDYSVFSPGYSLGPVDSLFVTRVDSGLALDGTYRKRIMFSSNGNSSTTDFPWISWVEGIGSNMGLLCPVSALPTNAIHYYLVCLNQNHEIGYYNMLFPSCYPINESISESSVQNKMEVSPNPFHQYTTLKLDGSSKISGLKVINSLGQVVLQKITTQGSTEEVVDLSKFPNGIYFLKMNGGDGVSRSVKLIKF